MRKLTTIFVLLLASPAVRGADLIIKSDAVCRLSVDGKSKRILEPNKSIRLKLPPGEHLIEAVPSNGGTKWQRKIALAKTKPPQELTISLSAAIGFWLDPVTNRTWTAVDNGSGLSWGQAQRYCRELSLGGFKDWTLPSIEQLQQVSQASANENGFRIKGPIRLTGWQWSATPGLQPGEGWAFDFGDGGRASVAAGDSGLNRALCIR